MKQKGFRKKTICSFAVMVSAVLFALAAMRLLSVYDNKYTKKASVSQDNIVFEFPHFFNPYVVQSAILKYSNRVICCDLTFGGRKALMPERLMDSTRSKAYPIA